MQHRIDSGRHPLVEMVVENLQVTTVLQVGGAIVAEYYRRTVSRMMHTLSAGKVLLYKSWREFLASQVLEHC